MISVQDLIDALVPALQDNLGSIGNTAHLKYGLQNTQKEQSTAFTWTHYSIGESERS